MILDPDNFSDEKIKEYIQLAEDFVHGLYNEQHLVGFQNENGNNTTNKNGDEGGKELSNQELLNQMNCDNKTKILYARLLKSKGNGGSEKGTETYNDQEEINRKKNEIRTTISNAVNDYVYYCKTKMDVVADLRKFGNERYEKEKSNIVYLRINPPICDGHYAHKFFDVLKWWQVIGAKRWPSLATGAAIVLGKPSHNGFQERVFSRGTYKDDPLKQRMKEENFEKSVLNSLNQEKVKSLMITMPQIVIPEVKYEIGRQQVNQFFEKEKQNKKIISEIGVNDDDSDDELKNEDDSDEVISVDEDEATSLDELVDFDDLSIMTTLEKEDELMRNDEKDNDETTTTNESFTKSKKNEN